MTCATDQACACCGLIGASVALAPTVMLPRTIGAIAILSRAAAQTAMPASDTTTMMKSRISSPNFCSEENDAVALRSDVATRNCVVPVTDRVDHNHHSGINAEHILGWDSAEHALCRDPPCREAISLMPVAATDHRLPTTLRSAHLCRRSPSDPTAAPPSLEALSESEPVTAARYFELCGCGRAVQGGRSGEPVAIDVASRRFRRFDS
jgi:hypothetical protein